MKGYIKVHSLWPVTMIESQATIGHHLGEPAMWRTPAIIVDATLALLTGASAISSGKAVYDEDVLESIGVMEASNTRAFWAPSRRGCGSTIRRGTGAPARVAVIALSGRVRSSDRSAHPQKERDLIRS